MFEELSRIQIELRKKRDLCSGKLDKAPRELCALHVTWQSVQLLRASEPGTSVIPSFFFHFLTSTLYHTQTAKANHSKTESSSFMILSTDFALVDTTSYRDWDFCVYLTLSMYSASLPNIHHRLFESTESKHAVITLNFYQVVI